MRLLPPLCSPLRARAKPLCVLGLLGLTGMPAIAAVQSVEILERVPFAEGMRFGEAGAYEKIRGIAHFALDPALPPMPGSST